MFLVPLAVLRGTRLPQAQESRLATLVYSVQEAPGEAEAALSLAVERAGDQHHRGQGDAPAASSRRSTAEGEERIVRRRLARALQIFLYREERVVLGPTLLPKRRCASSVLQDAGAGAPHPPAGARSAASPSRSCGEAEQLLRRDGGELQGLYFAFIEFVFNRIWPRVFQGFEYSRSRQGRRVHEASTRSCSCPATAATSTT